MAKKDEKPDTIKQLFEYAGNYRYLATASWVLATISAFVAKQGEVTAFIGPSGGGKTENIYSKSIFKRCTNHTS